MKQKIVFLTGAGVSAESGISTFRDSNGLWEQYNVMDVASIEGWYRNPELMLDFYNARRKDMLSVKPNAAHEAIAKLEEKYEVVVITQNIDDLHERAGSTNVIHLHGEVAKVCSSANKERYITTIPLDKPIHLGDQAPDGSQLRPYIVWFGEDVPNMGKAVEEVQEADIFVVMGTSLEVQPAASLAFLSHAEETYVIDPHVPHMMNQMDPHLHFLQEPATQGMQHLLETLT